MRIVFTSLLAFFGLGATALAQCTPDPNITGAPGLYPKGFPDATVGVAYNETVNVIMIKDTTISFLGQTLRFDMCTVKLKSVTGLAAGLSYVCDAANCEWTVDHTQPGLPKGCVNVFGTPTAASASDSAIVTVTVTPGTVDTLQANKPCTPAAGNWGALTTQNYKVRLKVTDPTSLDPSSGADLLLSLQPNPAKNNGELRFRLRETADVAVRISDLTGKTVATTSYGKMNGEQALALDYTNISNGAYFVQLILNGGERVLSRKLMIQQ